MEGSLPQELLDVFERSTTADFVTVDDHGRPLAWSVEPSFDAQAVCIAVGRAPTLRQALVDPHVALLFADEPPQPVVLVQGTAKVGDEDVRVRPERVYVWQRADLDAEPELYDSHVEEVRSAHNEEPEVGHAPPEGGPPAWDERLDELGTTHARFWPSSGRTASRSPSVSPCAQIARRDSCTSARTRSVRRSSPASAACALRSSASVATSRRSAAVGCCGPTR
jgi:hypothetical protein